jgi:hypothetical protein
MDGKMHKTAGFWKDKASVAGFSRGLVPGSAGSAEDHPLRLPLGFLTYSYRLFG